MPYNNDVGISQQKSLPMPRSLPQTPEAASAASQDDDFVHQFTRFDLRELIHLITQEIKSKGTKTPLLLLAFRPKCTDTGLSQFLEAVIPAGRKLVKTSVMEHIIKQTNEFTLIVALKYLWARLPEGSIVGWDAYLSFKEMEERSNYPKKAFLEFMPQCLSSPAHASIVYDFLDLIVSLAANAKENQMSGRKISKMTAVWAFHGPPPGDCVSSSPSDQSNFVEGLQNWLPAADAMFHLHLAFLRAMLPDDQSTKLQLPRTLQALLASNSYPPPDSTFQSSTLVGVPLVTIKTNKLSNTPIEMLNKLPKFLKFDNPSLFQVKEDFALLKSLCKNDGNVINKLSSESKRIIHALSQVNDQTRMAPGWPQRNQHTLKSGDVKTDMLSSSVPIDDYFIWAWLSSISFEQPLTKKRIFGRSLILEVVFDGFKKWVIIEEVTLDFKSSGLLLPERPKVMRTIQPQYKSMLEDVPPAQPKVMKKTKRTKIKQDLPPVPAPEVTSPPVSIPSHSEVSQQRIASSTLLKKFQKQQQQQKLPPTPLQSQEQRETSISYEPVELPPIEREQYRLSIPLDSFGLGDSPTREYFAQTRSDGVLPEQGQYKSLAPPAHDKVLLKNLKLNQEYHYWSSDKPKPTSVEATIHHPYPIQSTTVFTSKSSTEELNSPQHNHGPYQELGQMVDDLSIQNNQMKSKLYDNGGSKGRVGNHQTRAPIPTQLSKDQRQRPNSQIYEPIASPSQNHHLTLAQSPQRLKPELSQIVTTSGTLDGTMGKPRRKPPSEVSSVTPATAPVAYSSSGSVHPPSAGGIASSVYPSSSIYDPIDINHSRNGSPYDLRDQNGADQSVYHATSMINDVDNYVAEVIQRTSDSYTLPHDNGKDIYRDEHHNEREEEADLSRPTSAHYADSIIDTYRQPSIHHTRHKSSDSVEESRNRENPSGIVEENEFDTEGNQFDEVDASIIPSLSVADGYSIPVPSPPRSPLAKLGSPRLSSESSKSIDSYQHLQGRLDQLSQPVLLAPVSDSRQLVDSFSSAAQNRPPAIPRKNTGEKPMADIGSPQNSSDSIQSPQFQDASVLIRSSLDEYPSSPSAYARKSPASHSDHHRKKSPSIQNQRSRKESYPAAPGMHNNVNPHLTGLQNPHQSSKPLIGSSREGSPILQANLNKDSLRPNLSNEDASYLAVDPRKEMPSHSLNPSLSPRRASPYGQKGYGQPLSQHQTPHGASPSPSIASSGPSGHSYPIASTPQSDQRGTSPNHRGRVSPGRNGYPPPQSQGFYPPPQGYPNYPMPPQGYPPQGYPPQGYPPQGYPPQGYPPQGYPPQGYPPQGYPPQGIPWYPAPPHGYYQPPLKGPNAPASQKATASDVTLSNLPPTTAMNKLHHRPNKNDKKSIRNALVQGDFGI